MAKIKLKGHDSGTGVLTVTAPNTSTDRTITLPDSTATLFTDAGGTMTGTLSLQNNVSNSTSATLKLTGSSNVTQDNFILFGDNATSVPIAMGFDNSENTFKIARNSNDNLDSNVHLKMSSAGDITVGLGNLVIGTNGKGIDFSANADSSATGSSTTSELLDDYEEGTWTGTFQTGSGSVTMNTAKNTGRYTKIGRSVHVQGVFVSQSHSSAGGVLQLLGLPFANGSDVDLSEELWFYVGVNNIVNNNGATNQPLVGYMGAGNTGIIIYSNDGNNLGDAGNRINNNGYFGFSFTYTI